MPSDKHIYVWAISKTTAIFRSIEFNGRLLAMLIGNLRKSLDVAGLGDKAPAFDFDSAQTLYQVLLKPIEDQISTAKHLIFAPAGALSQIPFGALISTKPADAPYSGANWLIRTYAVSHTASASAWKVLRDTRTLARGQEPFVGWGDPLFDFNSRRRSSPSTTRQVNLARASSEVISGDVQRSVVDYSKIPPLPETRDELNSIAAALSANPAADVILGAEATKASILNYSLSGKLQRKRVVAFATHGLISGDLPNVNQPALAMAGTGDEASNPESALLTLQDVLTLRLNADWVILSACNTAAADGQAGESLSGLARGFFYAGSRSVLVTHWAVDSDSAKLLTTGTFEHYTKNPEAIKAESLRHAMLMVMKLPEYAHPAFWAPFALIGDGGR
jgi:CHAT domain-containing protein